MRRGLAATLAALIAALACGDTDLGCPSELTSCGEFCTDFRVDAENCGGCGKVCAKGEVCQGGKCAVPACTFGSKPERCDGKCVDLDFDENNCGECGKACPPTKPGFPAVCSGGECR